MDFNRNLRIVRTKDSSYPLPYKSNVLWVHYDDNNNPVIEIWGHGKWVPVTEVGSGSDDIIIDTEMSDSSSNAIANETVKKYIDGIASKTDASILSLNEGKVDKEPGKGLSANDLTDERAEKVDILAKDGSANEYLNGAGTYSRPVMQGYGVSVADDNTVSVDQQVIASQSDVANVASDLAAHEDTVQLDNRVVAEAIVSLAARLDALEGSRGLLGDATAGTVDVRGLTRCRYPLVMLGHGVPAEANVPVNLPDGLPWDGVPAFAGQQYINLDAASGGLYYAAGVNSVAALPSSRDFILTSAPSLYFLSSVMSNALAATPALFSATPDAFPAMSDVCFSVSV